MVSSKKLFTEFLLYRGALRSAKAVDYIAIEVAMFLNRAYTTIISHLVEEQGQNQTINNYLRHLLSSPKNPLKCSKIDSNCCEVIYPEDFLYRNSLDVVISNDCCPGKKKTVDADFPQHDELDKERGNPFSQSNYFWEQVIAQDSKDGAVIYHDCAFKVECAILRYYKNPTPISLTDFDNCGGSLARDWDGKIITDTDLNACPPHLADKIVEVAVYYAAVANNEVSFSELNLKEIITNNSIYK